MKYRHVVKSALLVLSIVVLTTAAGAQDQPQKLSTYVKAAMDASERGVSAARQNILGVVPNAEATRIRRVNIRVARSNWDVFGTRAGSDANGDYIEIPVGFLLAADLMDRAMLEAIMMERHQELASYVTHVGQQLRSADAAVRSNGSPPPIRFYCEYVGSSPQQCNQLRSSARYDTHLNEFKVTSITFIVAHELGHHVKEHLKRSSPLSSYQIEREADVYAIQLITKLGLNPLLTTGTFLVFASFVTNDVPQSGWTGGEDATCRLVNVLTAAFQFTEQTKQYTNRANFERYKRDLERVRSQAPHCR